jgi:hypothetical protein
MWAVRRMQANKMTTALVESFLNENPPKLNINLDESRTE